MYIEFFKDDMVSPLANKKTLKLYNEKMKNTIAQISNEDNLDKNYSKQDRIIQNEKIRIRKSLCKAF